MSDFIICFHCKHKVDLSNETRTIYSFKCGICGCVFEKQKKFGASVNHKKWGKKCVQRPEKKG